MPDSCPQTRYRQADGRLVGLAVDSPGAAAYFPDLSGALDRVAAAAKDQDMKVVNSLKSAKSRDKNCRIVRRRGRVYVINKKNPRFKARQG